MTAQRYADLTAWWRGHPHALSALRAVNRGLKYLGYFMYPLLLVLVALHTPDLLVRMVLVPLIGFVFTTVLRMAVNAPRPYEALDIDPLIVKSTKGKSFPSRHMFCMFMIAMCWLRWLAPVGALLIVSGIVMGYIRVIGGVHFLRDVICGALIGLLFGMVGFWLL